MRNSISRLFRGCCFFVPPIHHHPTPAKASDFVSFHTIYAYVTGLLLALIEIKYQGLSINLFKEHMVMMMLFLISKFVYVIALVTFPSNQTNDHQWLDLKVVVCHVSGTIYIACELLLLLLVSPIHWFIINLSTLILVLIMFLSYKYLMKLLNHNQTQLTVIHNAEGQSDDQTVNMETEITSTL